jgi:hypothetical protein
VNYIKGKEWLITLRKNIKKQNWILGKRLANNLPVENQFNKNNKKRVKHSNHSNTERVKFAFSIIIHMMPKNFNKFRKNRFLPLMTIPMKYSMKCLRRIIVDLYWTHFRRNIHPKISNKLLINLLNILKIRIYKLQPMMNQMISVSISKDQSKIRNNRKIRINPPFQTTNKIKKTIPEINKT